MNMENGWTKHLEADKKIGEEVEIEKILLGIQELLPAGSRITLGVSGSDYPIQREALKKDASFFLGHPDRVVWLKSYLEESKAKMKAVVPEGDLSSLKDRARLNLDYFGKDPVSKTAREIRDGYLQKDFEEEEAEKAKATKLGAEKQDDTMKAGVMKKTKEAEVEVARKAVQGKY